MKVYCKDCEFIGFWCNADYCKKFSNVKQDSYFRPNDRFRIRFGSEINKNNNCPYYQPSWFKKFKNWFKGNK